MVRIANSSIVIVTSLLLNFYSTTITCAHLSKFSQRMGIYSTPYSWTGLVYSPDWTRDRGLHYYPFGAAPCSCQIWQFVKKTKNILHQTGHWERCQSAQLGKKSPNWEVWEQNNAWFFLFSRKLFIIQKKLRVNILQAGSAFYRPTIPGGLEVCPPFICLSVLPSVRKNGSCNNS